MRFLGWAAAALEMALGPAAVKQGARGCRRDSGGMIPEGRRTGRGEQIDMDRRQQVPGLRGCWTAIVASAALPWFWRPPAAAQDYPQRVVTIIVPYPAGGARRHPAARHGGRAGAADRRQSFIVDNKPGATQTIGARLAASAKPDGDTIFLRQRDQPRHQSEPQEGAALRSREGLRADLAHFRVAAISDRAARPAGQLRCRELIELAKRTPGKLNYASIGPGSSAHLAGELLKTMAGIDMTHIPYTGSAPAVRDTIAGHVDLTFTGGGMTYAEPARSRRWASPAPRARPPPRRCRRSPRSFRATRPRSGSAFWRRPARRKAIVGRLAREMKTAVHPARCASG